MKVGFRKNKKVHLARSTFLSALLGISLLMIVGFLINTNLKINRQKTELLSQIETLNNEIKTLEEKGKEMKERISQAASKEYLEEVARDQLGWQLSGEEVVVITEEEEEKEKGIEEEKSFLKKWWDWIKNIF